MWKMQTDCKKNRTLKILFFCIDDSYSPHYFSLSMLILLCVCMLDTTEKLVWENVNHEKSSESLQTVFKVIWNDRWWSALVECEWFSSWFRLIQQPFICFLDGYCYNYNMLTPVSTLSYWKQSLRPLILRLPTWNKPVPLVFHLMDG